MTQQSASATINAEYSHVLGRSSVSTIEIVSGPRDGDQVILSDTSAMDNYNRIRVR